MAQWILTPKDFLTGMAPSEEFGGLWEDQQAIDIERSETRNDIGALRSGYLATSVSSLSVLPKRVAKVPSNNISASDNAGTLLLFMGGVSGIVVDPQGIKGGGVDGATTFSLSATAPITTGDLGLGVLSAVSAGYTAYAATQISASNKDRLIRITSISATNPLWADPGTLEFNFNNVPHPSYLKNNILWWGDKNQIAKLATDETLTLNALDLHPDYVIQTISEYDKYLAIGATRGNSSRAIESRMFLWDMISDSWNFDFPIYDAITQLKNDKGTLYAYTIGEDFSVLKFTGNSFDPIRTERGATFTNQPPFLTDVVDIDRGKHYISMLRTDSSSNIQPAIWSMGSYLGDTNAFHIPFVATSLGNSLTAGVVAVGGNTTTGGGNKVYQGYISGSAGKIVVYKTGNFADAECSTVELDSYFGGNGALKKMNWIRFEFDRINVDGDRLDIYDFIDYVTSSTRLDGESAVGTGNSIRKTDLGATASSKTFPLSKQFRQYRLRLIFVAGNVRVRKIVIDWDPVNVKGR